MNHKSLTDKNGNYFQGEMLPINKESPSLKGRVSFTIEAGGFNKISN